MTFKHNLVATIKVGGKILREYDNSVLIPFGTEYSVYIRNLNSVRALVKVSIDGTDATEDTWLIIDPNGSLELERFIRNGNFDRGNRFKFIERTGEIEQHRGIKAEDGLIRIEYRFEVPPVNISYVAPQYTPWNGSGIIRGNGFLGQNFFNTTVTSSVPDLGGATLKSNAAVMNLCSQETSVSDAGITVAGSESDQKFVHGSWFPTETASHVIVLSLRGEVVGQAVKTAVTVDHKPECSTCGRKNKAKSKFCSNCGTALNLI